MEARAPYHAALAPKGPRNLARPLAAWLRTQGFTALEREQPHFAAVDAHWLGPRGERFQLDYTWSSGPVPSATCRLTVGYPGKVQAEVLFTPQTVRRLKDARLLLTGNQRYANARLLATLPHPAL